MDVIDHWTSCPRCLRDARIKYVNKAQQVKDQYGKISLEEFIALTKEVQAEAKDITCVAGKTLKEICEVYLDDEGVLFIDYHASCRRCDFKLTYKIQKEADLSAYKVREAKSNATS